MACDTETLQQDACEDQLVGYSDRQLFIIIAQALCSDMSTCDPETLMAEACANGVAGYSYRQLLIMIAQSLCDGGGGGGGGGTTNYQGAGSPEGVQTASVNAVYRDTSTDAIWWKASGVGNTGWEQMTGPI